MSEHPAPPEGYKPWQSKGGYAHLIGPQYRKRDGDMVSRGLFLDERHINGIGLGHGGILMTIADNTAATAAAFASRGNVVTVRLTTDFIAPAHQGDWLFAEARVTRATRDLVFSSAEVFAQNLKAGLPRLVMTAQGVFKTLGKAARTPEKASRN